MPYKVEQDTFLHKTTLRQTFGGLSRVITPSVNDIEPYPKSIILGAVGDVTYLPAGNADGVTVTLVNYPPGSPVPHRVRKVLSATVTIYSVED